MKPLHKRLIGALIGVAALIIVIRRRMQPIQPTPLLPQPAPPPPEPPRIVLPAEVVNGSDGVPEAEVPAEIVLNVPAEAEEVAAEEEPVADEAVEEEPLIEMEVGGASPAPARPPAAPAADADADAAEDDGEELDPNQPQAYCVSCREKRPMEDAHEETLDNGRPALRGTCAVCGSKMVRFLPKRKDNA